MGTRMRRWAAAASVVALVSLTACEGVVYHRADTERVDVGLPKLARSKVLAASAADRSAEMCADGTVTPSADPEATYDRETIAAAHELVGAAPLDPGISDPTERSVAATNEVLASWTDPPWTEPRWDDLGVGQAVCPDGNLYLTAVTTERPSMPSSGRYSSRVYASDRIVEQTDVHYRTAPDYRGQQQDLHLDLYLPPSHGADRPLVILVHGGGFAHGDKSKLASTARDHAQRGFVAVSLDYRLNPTLDGQNDLEAYIAAAHDAIDDGREAVRWLRANAATYEIDGDRIAMMGTSAGGGVALAVAVIDDPTPGGPLGHVSPDIQAAVATGATLTLGLDEISAETGGRPVMMIHFEVDTATGATTADVDATCEAIWSGGGTCDRVMRPGSGHGSPLSGTGPFGPTIGPFVWEHLDLAS